MAGSSPINCINISLWLTNCVVETTYVLRKALRERRSLLEFLDLLRGQLDRESLYVVLQMLNLAASNNRENVYCLAQHICERNCCDRLDVVLTALAYGKRQGIAGLTSLATSSRASLIFRSCSLCSGGPTIARNFSPAFLRSSIDFLLWNFPPPSTSHGARAIP